MAAFFNKTLAAGAVMLVVGLAGGWMLSGLKSAPPADDPHAGHGAPAGERKVLYWYDPMVPTQRFDKPGKSPFMDMDLVPRHADEADSDRAPAVTVSAHAAQSLGLRVAVAEARVLQPSVDVVGTVGLDERDVSIVQARADGFVERTYARAPGDVVAAGAPLADVLHPQWLSAQREYLAVRATGDAVLTQAARARLGLLGMPAGWVERVDAGGEPLAVTTIVAPSGGLIAELMVRPGMTVAAGMTLARINGLGTVWVEAAVPEALAAAVTLGQRAELRLAAFPGEVLRGRVAAVLPEASRDTRTLRVRIEVPNPRGRLRAGLFAQVSLLGAAHGREVVTVPAESVIRTGRRALVYVVDADGRYRPVEVQLGAEVDGHVAVLQGIAAGQQVVASGQFLVDSEASLLGLTARADADTIRAPGAPVGGSPSSAGAAAGFATRGRVVELDGATITVEHEPVPALKWPAMTMPFQLSRPDLARGLGAGDAIRFRFNPQGDEHVITAIERDGTAAPGGGHAGHGGSAGGRP